MTNEEIAAPDALHITIYITDTATGEERLVAKRSETWDDVEFLYTDGNYACDCNREILFRAVKGEDDSHRQCGDKRFILRVTDSEGNEIYSEYEDD